ncbi:MULTISPECIES: methyltransferase family protein [Pseudonocardiaceae]|uniref:Isoprenylcysteine carboxylmethyltransferase family protein n=1 Tax=Saccharopolyspora endophytica TaxID=543886 RepID=A0ABS5DHL9_9PSEU|nr:MULTISPECIES: isoprenylcysteine carboxylmethyltransferase family protein [Pseudonocardiaceae]MBQ0925784.1 isoprenylcysteine carboxylmethyltransferase family protein [Saccharopolyspora endophytica]OLT43763.1 isoprenylcysteine carboxyl methyltransferase [Saccharomonospora sp. CUA-673]
MATVALALYLTFLLTAFGLRSVLQYRRTGSTGFHGVSGRPGSVEWWGGVLFVVALVLGLAAPVLQLGSVIDALTVLDTTAVHVAGLIVALAGIVGTLMAQQTMGSSWRIGVDQRETTELVTADAFALVRNPIFSTMITAGMGLTLLAPNPIALAGLVALLAAIEIQVRAVEEPYLLRTHGQVYRGYASRVGRFFPGIGRLAVHADGVG